MSNFTVFEGGKVAQIKYSTRVGRLVLEVCVCGVVVIVKVAGCWGVMVPLRVKMGRWQVAKVFEHTSRWPGDSPRSRH